MNKITLGQQIEWVISDIRRDVQVKYLPVEYLDGLFGSAVAKAAIAYLEEKKEILVRNGEIGKIKL